MSRKIVRKALIVILVFLILVGLSMILIPMFQARCQEQQMEQVVESWENDYGSPENTTVDKHIETSTLPTCLVFPELREAMESYNINLHQTGQADLVDAWSYQETVFDLSSYGIHGEAVGVITIPAIDVKLPLYLGASYENMSKGFAQLSQTSMPIGGIGTNCVVACHRGYQGAAYLRDADKISAGDLVYLTNFWETLSYEVISIKVISPDDMEEILIQPGKDLLTLVTCTPYRVGSHRLLIICERVQ